MTYLIGATFFGLLVVYIVLRYYRQWRLAKEGIVAQGRVIRKTFTSGKRSDSSSGFIKYQFLTPRGEYVEKSVVVGEAILVNCVEGAEIDVVYLKDRPQTSEVKHTVDSTRASMNLPPLPTSKYG